MTMGDEEQGRLSACDRFILIVKGRFNFLATEYAFNDVASHCVGPEMWLVFANERVQVSIHFEYGSGMWITLRRAPNGEEFNLDCLLRLRAPHRERVLKVEGFDAHQVDEYTHDRAEALREYAGDILRGDFSIFPALAKISEQMSAEWLRSGDQ